MIAALLPVLVGMSLLAQEPASAQPATGAPAAVKHAAPTELRCTLATTRVDEVSAPSGPHTWRNNGTGSTP